MEQAANRSSFWQYFGPGILFAGAAIGTSHLVQSTRAGAMFGLGLLGVIILANLIKYPAFRFGTQYAAATGRSLLHAYRDIGNWVLVLFILSELVMMAIVIAATAIVTGAILLAVSNFAADAKLVAIALIGVGGVMLSIGGFRLLDRLTKLFVAILTITTLCATILTLPSVEWNFAQVWFPLSDLKTLAFVVAVMGFMPAGTELSVMQSLWVVEKKRAASEQQSSSHQSVSVKHALADFNFGYIASAILAICFLLMGTGVMHNSGELPAASGAAFAKQVIGLYTHNLGSWAGVLVGVSALFVMFSTLLTVLDGFPRLLSKAINLLRNQNNENGRLEKPFPSQGLCMIVLGALAAGVLLFFMGSFTSFIDVVTITAFILTPLAALLNHIAMHAAVVPSDYRPTQLLTIWSVLGIAVLTGLSLMYLFVRLA